MKNVMEWSHRIEMCWTHVASLEPSLVRPMHDINGDPIDITILYLFKVKCRFVCGVTSKQREYTKAQHVRLLGHSCECDIVDGNCTLCCKEERAHDACTYPRTLWWMRVAQKKNLQTRNTGCSVNNNNNSNTFLDILIYFIDEQHQ